MYRSAGYALLPLLLALAGQMVACDDASFKGSTAHTSADKTANAVPTKTDGPNGTKDPNATNPGPSDPNDPNANVGNACDSNGLTQAKVLTPTVQNGVPGNFIQYELSLTDCEGKRKSFTADAILFDIEGWSSTAGQGVALKYTIKGAAQDLQGELEEIQGTDLFGNSGPNYYHNRTDKNVTVTTDTSTITMTVDLGGQLLRRNEDGGTVAEPKVTLPTFLRFGKAAPVQKDVDFIAP